MERITGQGFELQGDGFARALSRIKAAGFETVTEYVESHPTASLLEIADELNRSDADDDPLPVAADHVAVLWREEALDAGEAAFERFARRAMVGEIHRHFASGWPTQTTEESRFSLIRAAVTWTAVIGHDLEARANETWFALVDSQPPPGWLPENADDPRIIAAFSKWSVS